MLSRALSRRAAVTSFCRRGFASSASRALICAAARPSARAMATVGAEPGAPGTRVESDTMGKIAVSKSVYWGAQTQRSLENFKIGGPQARMPIEIIRGMSVARRCSSSQRSTTWSCSGQGGN